jgi:hypothetical protein
VTTFHRPNPVLGAKLAAAALKRRPTLAGAADVLLIAAEVEITEQLAWLAAHEDLREDDPARASAYAQVWRLEDFVAHVAPATLAVVAVKLRRVLDREIGIVTQDCDNELPSLIGILDFIHSIVGLPTHPTRPTVSREEVSAG